MRAICIGDGDKKDCWQTNTNDNNPLLEDNNGRFDQKTADKLRLFRRSFNMDYTNSRIGNTVVNYDAATKTYPGDNTSDTFRKLMKETTQRMTT